MIAIDLSKQQATDADPKAKTANYSHWKYRSNSEKNNVFHC